MRVLFLGRKPVACEALSYLVSRAFTVTGVVVDGSSPCGAGPEPLIGVANSLGIPVITAEMVYKNLSSPQPEPGVDLHDIDLVVSVLYQKRIQRPLIDVGRIGCINFHPAPLPEYRGWGTYNVAILDNVQCWGASAHFVDDGFDSGPLIAVRSFEVDAARETALSLQIKTQPVLLDLFKQVIDTALDTGTLDAVSQGPGITYSKATVLARRYIKHGDPPELVDKTIRAFWYPPNPCAEIEIAGSYYPVIDRDIFQQIIPLICAQNTKVL